MRKVLAAAALSLLAAPAIAATSGTLSGSTTIAYACDMTLPGNITMIQSSATTASGTGTMPYAQNAETIYALEALTVTHPAGSPLVVGSLTFIDKNSNQVVTNSSESTRDIGTIFGIEAGTGTIEASVVDTILTAGSYTVSGTITCSEVVP